MATIMVLLQPENPEIADWQGRIIYRISRAGEVCDYVSAYLLKKTEWIQECGKVIWNGASMHRREELKRVSEMIIRETTALRNIIRNIEEGGGITASNIKSKFENYLETYRTGNFIRRLENCLRKSGRVRTAETYRSAWNAFRHFLESRVAWINGGHESDIHLLHITPELMQIFEGWMRSRGLVANTTSFYLRILRSVYNQAVAEEAVDDCRPFRRVYTGVERTVKRALSIRTLRRIRELNLTERPDLAYARDMFMLSFYLRGMSIIDMAFLRKSDLVGNILTYRRRKTGQLLTIRWTSEMQEILQRYSNKDSVYLLPIIRRSGVKGLYVYRHACRRINYDLKRVAEIIGFHGNLTLYVARHSWASVARTKGIPLSVISEGMGHESEMTTRIYLAELDSSVVDRANNLILKALG